MNGLAFGAVCCRQYEPARGITVCLYNPRPPIAQVSGNTLQKVDKCKCLGLVSTSDSARLNKEIFARIGKVYASNF